ncbi:MAG TPA: transaldolase family protein [Pseudomonas sp.]|uniref:transaldolase family protein n=1 Tax=Pseudomonas sp. TaxID=306 RepID=UPI002ED8D64E
MDIPEFVRALKDQSSDSEVWWDASPTEYETFRKLLFDRYPSMLNYISQLLPEHFLDTPAGISGATTNPRLIARAVLEHADIWHDAIKIIDHQLPAAHRARQLYDQLIGEGARQLHPLWILSRRRYGWLSAQVDTTQLNDVEGMVKRGLELAQISPNVMIKVPGSLAGYQAIERLVAQGCSINNTLCFTVSQAAACLDAIHRGQLLARQKKVDVSTAQYVITFMIGRFGDEQQFNQYARQRGIALSDTDKRWAELAMYQALQALLQRRSTPARLLLCSLRVDTNQQGEEYAWHLERTGADTTLYTLTPEIIEFLVRRQASGLPVLPIRQRLRIPDEVMNKLLCIAYFTDAYFEGGIEPAAFENHPAFITARNEACIAHGQLQGFVDGFAMDRPLSMSAWEPKAESAGASL